MQNPYKRTDVFSCSYKGHEKFQNRVSVYHVMHEKHCYPQGCLMFRWQCRVKRGKCPRKFKYVGRLCKGCMHYQDEKMHYQPRLLISLAEFESFKQELQDFDDWIEENRSRDIELWCRVGSIKPHFYIKEYGNQRHFRLSGYLAVFHYGFMGTTRFDDTFYAYISPSQQDRFRLAAGDEFEARGRLSIDHGRLLFPKLWGIHVETRSGAQTWNNSRALVAKQSATRFKEQPESCIRCPHGALIDIIKMEQGQKHLKRALYCLEGIQDPAVCYIQSGLCIDACENSNRK